MVHRGEIIEKAVRKSGYPLAYVANKLGITRSTLYNRFNHANVSWEFITHIGKLIHYDFTLDFPELKDKPELLGPGAIKQIEGKYIRLLEKYNQLLGLVIRIGEQTEAIHIRHQIVELMDKKYTEKQG